MSRIAEAILPPTEFGNDPNDNRYDENYLQKAVSIQPKKWMEDLTLDQKEIEALTAGKWVYPNLIRHNHVTVVPAPPNGGKTTLMLWIAGVIAKDYDVYYVNADVSGTDAKSMAIEAKQKGFSLVLPDLKSGSSMKDVVAILEEMNRQGGDFTNMVFFFDTLKKMTDVINKSHAKRLFELFRGLSGKGMTIVLLAHTNKHKGDDGKLIFEGTGDIRADCDEMIYLEANQHQDGSITISTVPDKKRCDIEPLTFEVHKDRSVIPSESYKDLSKERKERQQREKDHDVIEEIKAALLCGQSIQKDVIKHCEQNGIGKSRTRKVLDHYSQESRRIWYASKGAKNSWSYSLGTTPPENRKTEKTE
jgi:energy-coupling factor transporter ATP-binding protein EcfA2